MPKKRKEPNAKPKLGATYQATKMLVQIGGPPAYGAIQGGGTLEERVKFQVLRPGYHKSVAVALVDAWGSKKLGHAQALSRKSITAWAPEVFATGGSAIDADFDPANTYNEFQSTTTGYQPSTQTFSTKFPKTRTYFLAKYAGGIGRRIVNQTRIAEPVKKALGMLGVAL